MPHYISVACVVSIVEKQRPNQVRARGRLYLALFLSPKVNAVRSHISIFIHTAVMDPVSAIGIATAVVGLLPLCASGCSFIEGLCKAHGNLQEQMNRIRMQQAVCHPRI